MQTLIEIFADDAGAIGVKCNVPDLLQALGVFEAGKDILKAASQAQAANATPPILLARGNLPPQGIVNRRNGN